MPLSRDEVLFWLNERLGSKLWVALGAGRGRDAEFALMTVGTLQHLTAEITPPLLDALSGLGTSSEELTRSYLVGDALLTLSGYPDLRGRIGDLNGIPMLDIELGQDATLRVAAIQEQEEEEEENDG